LIEDGRKLFRKTNLQLAILIFASDNLELAVVADGKNLCYMAVNVSPFLHAEKSSHLLQIVDSLHRNFSSRKERRSLATNIDKCAFLLELNNLSNYCVANLQKVFQVLYQRNDENELEQEYRVKPEK
jgi:hypothetical protein